MSEGTPRHLLIGMLAEWQYTTGAMADATADERSAACLEAAAFAYEVLTGRIAQPATPGIHEQAPLDVATARKVTLKASLVSDDGDDDTTLEIVRHHLSRVLVRDAWMDVKLMVINDELLIGAGPKHGVNDIVGAVIG